jgi:hypothetical protein
MRPFNLVLPICMQMEGNPDRTSSVSFAVNVLNALLPVEVASNTTSNDMIVAGGPMYWGKVSSSIDGYLKTLSNNAKLGVFVTTGSSNYVESDFASLEEQVTMDTHDGKVAIQLILTGSETNDCADLVSTLVQQG